MTHSSLSDLSTVTPKRTPRQSSLVLGLLGLAISVLLWWLLTLPALSSQPLLRLFSPGATFHALGQLIVSGELWPHIGVSLRRIVEGLFLALILGIPLGIIVGARPTMAALTGPTFQFLRMISPLSWMPLAVMALGIGDRPIIFLLAFAALWPILLSTAQGVQSLDPQLRLLSRSLSATGSEEFLHVILPGIVGAILQGIRLAIGTLWIILVPCEMLGVQAGLGYFILDTRDRLDYSQLTATVLVIGILGFALDGLARSMIRRLQPFE